MMHIVSGITQIAGNQLRIHFRLRIQMPIATYHLPILTRDLSICLQEYVDDSQDYSYHQRSEQCPVR